MCSRIVGAGFVAQVAYVGSSTHDLYYPNQIDQPAPGSGAIQPAVRFRNTAPCMHMLRWSVRTLSLCRPRWSAALTRRLSVLAAYTLGHSIDNGSSQVDTGVPARRTRLTSRRAWRFELRCAQPLCGEFGI